MNTGNNGGRPPHRCMLAELHGVKQLTTLLETASEPPLAEKWMDKQEVLIRMHISARTLQRCRDEKLITFTRIRGKIYYLRSDIEEMLLSNSIRKK